MKDDRSLCILIGALGGQGGGVLANWLVTAARLAGYPAQATSIPGVAQRTGATTYYFELFPDKNPTADPIFCLFPSAGDVDMVVALEPVEAGRALESGYISTQTTVITGTQRIYSTAEKSVAGDGAVPVGPILESLRQAAQRLVAVDPDLAPGRQLNAVIFGAMIGCGILPLTAENGRATIKETGLAVAANIAGFEAGVELSTVNDQYSVFSGQYSVFSEMPEAFAQEVKGWPEKLRPLLGHALARLADYQDAAYAGRYLERLQPLLALDDGVHQYRVTAEVARRLAAWMSYEDVIRVAQLKTKPGRLNRIREEASAKAGEPVSVHDYLSPGRTELAGLLPAALARFIPAEKDGGGRSLHLAWPTSSPLGYGLLKVMAKVRWMRPHTEAYIREQAAMDNWLTAVIQTIAVDYDLACLLAETAVLARGYGVVRLHGLNRLDMLLENWPQKLKGDGALVWQEVTAVLHVARQGDYSE
ncbi:MAG: indolepyruvate oxidoreductase subunit beta family protein [Chloroflexi bacterium]|nr:indolepyruvate oxidoreductase subunit beta family protein [Chloroflexota bacterium]